MSDEADRKKMFDAAMALYAKLVIAREAADRLLTAAQLAGASTGNRDCCFVAVEALEHEKRLQRSVGHSLMLARLIDNESGFGTGVLDRFHVAIVHPGLTQPNTNEE